MVKEYLNFKGVGLNLFNTEPLFSVSDAIKIKDIQRKRITKETFLSNFMVLFNGYMDRYLTSGFDEFLPMYYSRWLHSDQVIFLEEEGAKARITGLSKEGYLKAELLDGLYSVIYPQPSLKKEFVLEPNGNHFDMMKNLISRKQKHK